MCPNRSAGTAHVAACKHRRCRQPRPDTMVSGRRRARHGGGGLTGMAIQRRPCAGADRTLRFGGALHRPLAGFPACGAGVAARSVNTHAQRFFRSASWKNITGNDLAGQRAPQATREVIRGASGLTHFCNRRTFCRRCLMQRLAFLAALAKPARSRCRLRVVKPVGIAPLKVVGICAGRWWLPLSACAPRIARRW